jgi:hypothetical protein
MTERVKLAGTLATVPLGISSGAASGEIDLGSFGQADIFEDVRQRDDWHIATPGPVGAAFVALDTPERLAQLYLCSRNESEIALRFNGAPAVSVAGGFDPTAIADGDSFLVSIDQARPFTTVRFTNDDRSWDAVLARINGALGQRVADRTERDQIRLTGAKTGGQSARERGWQHGSIELGGSSSTLIKLGFLPGLTVGAGTDLVVRRRFLFEPPSTGPHAIHSIELSGSAELVTHVAGF